MMSLREEQQYAEDCAYLLSAALEMSYRRYKVRADMLEPVIRFLGYRVSVRKNLPEKVLSYCDFDRKLVVVARDFAERLEFPESATGVLKATLAHELGHIRLHGPLAVQGLRQPQWEREAHAYALVFLLPRAELLGRPETHLLLRALEEGQEQEALWRLVIELGRSYRVTGAFMARALVTYKLIRMGSRQRDLRPRNPRPAEGVYLGG